MDMMVGCCPFDEAAADRPLRRGGPGELFDKLASLKKKQDTVYKKKCQKNLHKQIQ